MGRRYVRNVVNAHLDVSGTEDAIRAQHALYGPISAVLIEDKVNGSAVISFLKSNLSGVTVINPEGGKWRGWRQRRRVGRRTTGMWIVRRHGAHRSWNTDDFPGRAQ